MIFCLSCAALNTPTHALTLIPPSLLYHSGGGGQVGGGAKEVGRPHQELGWVHNCLINQMYIEMDICVCKI